MRSWARKGQEIQLSHVAVILSIPTGGTNVTGHLTKMFNNRQTPPCSRLMRSFMCVLFSFISLRRLHTAPLKAIYTLRPLAVS